MAGGAEWTILNPYDGGVVLKWKTPSELPSDGCSSGIAEWKAIFLEPCLAHDIAYKAPWKAAAFPSYPNGASIGKELADWLFLQDALRKGTGITGGYSNAYLFNRSFSDFSKLPTSGVSPGAPTAIGGVFTVKNSGAYTLKCRLKWTGPRGALRIIEESATAGARALVVPISIGAKNFEADCWAEGGSNIFVKKLGGPGMYAFTVDGTTLIHSVRDGLS